MYQPREKSVSYSAAPGWRFGGFSLFPFARSRVQIERVNAVGGQMCHLPRKKAMKISRVGFLRKWLKPWIFGDVWPAARKKGRIKKNTPWIEKGVKVVSSWSLEGQDTKSFSFFQSTLANKLIPPIAQRWATTNDYQCLKVFHAIPQILQKCPGTWIWHVWWFKYLQRIHVYPSTAVVCVLITSN